MADEEKQTAPAPTSENPADVDDPAPSTADLLSSASLLAGTAKSVFAHDTGSIDKVEVAGAAADLLGAAKQYGSLDEYSYGKYVDKAEDYLEEYSQSSTAADPAPPSTGDGADKEPSQREEDTAPPQEEKVDADAGGGGGGYGDLIKLAQGLFLK